MPQLDKLIFFMENLGFVMSFFFMVFYNQYVFYPRLLKNLFVRKQILLNYNLNNIFQNLVLFYTKQLFFKNSNLNALFLIFEEYLSNTFKKLNYFLQLKYKIIRYFLVLIVSKFKFLFSLFYPVYRQYIVEIKKPSFNYAY